jgi:hypothetical protein
MLCTGYFNGLPGHDGETDETSAVDTTTWYTDFDDDGYGASSGPTTTSCTAPPLFADNTLDCDDIYPTSYAGATELCDGTDNNCDGLVDMGGSAVLFDQADVPISYVNVAFDPILNFGSDDWTIETWAHITTREAESWGHRLIGRASGAYPTIDWWAVDITEDGTPKMEVVNILDDGSLQSGVTNATDVLGLDGWSHIAIVVSRTDNTTTFYIDGVISGIIDMNPEFSAATIENTSDLSIGGAWNSFHGMIDEVRIWRTARTEAEIQHYMCDQVDPTESTLIGYWPFESDIVDQGPNALGGTQYGVVNIVSR